MGNCEFKLISRYFDRSGLTVSAQHSDIRLGIGDDCALLNVPNGFDLALSMDVLVEGVHFPAGAPANLVAQRALRVNLSDLAAMGALPLGFTLGLSLPHLDHEWLQSFSDGLTECAIEFNCPLMGGDTTRGPLTIVIQVHGQVQSGAELRRSGAKIGDDVYVSGYLGSAAAALVAVIDGQINDGGDLSDLTKSYFLPVPRLQLAQRLGSLATAAIDLSDGLVGDLCHIAHQSHSSIRLHSELIPVSKLVSKQHLTLEALKLALSGGDDYELAFTASPDYSEQIQALALELDIPLTRIGEVITSTNAESPVSCIDENGIVVPLTDTGYQHF